MNQYHQNLYANLFRLSEENEAFFHQDFQLDGKTYRIFNYRLASYTDFLSPGALECRGIMFEMNGELPIRLASMPMHKFFNLNENPMTIGLDLSKVSVVETKADGSLISTYEHNNELRLKTRGSLFSDQAIDAMEWLKQHPTFYERLRRLDDIGFTVNLEWCAPQNRIVIGYVNPHLKVLNARYRATGDYMEREFLEQWFNPEELIDRVDLQHVLPATFIASIPDMQDDIEGYVCRVGDLWFKVKTNKYLSLHHAKDSVNNPRRLFEAILDEGIDDLRSLFATDAPAMAIIDAMQVKVSHMYNHMVTSVEEFYNMNRNLDRKSYAIKGQEHFKGTLFFGLAMNKYIGKPTEYKQFLKSKWKELGFRDVSLEGNIE